MSWFWVPSDYTPPSACWNKHAFLNQFIDVINGCTDLYNWSVSTGAAITDLDEVVAGDNVQSVSFWDSIQTRIELLIGVAHDYDLVVNGSDVDDYSLYDTISLVEYKRFKDLANATGAGTPNITTAHRFSTTPGDGFGWKRVDSAGAAAIGKIQAGDCINVQLFNQLYAACFVLQDFCILETPSTNDNWVRDDAYTGYIGTGTDTAECADEFEPCQRNPDGGDDPDPDAGYWDSDPSVTLETACGNARGVWNTYWGTLSLQDKSNSTIQGAYASAERDAGFWCLPHEFRDPTYYWEAYRRQFKADFTNLPVSPPLSIKQFGRITGPATNPSLFQGGASFCPWEYPSADEDTVTDVTETTGHAAATLTGVEYPGATDNPANKAAPSGVYDVACDNHQTGICDLTGSSFDNPNPYHIWSYSLAPWAAIKAQIPDPTRTEP